MLSIFLKTFSVAFSYPTSSLFDAMQNGDLVHVLREEAELLSNSDELLTLITEVENGINSILDNGLQSLESDYIALFEANREHGPVHMYAHLYNNNQEEYISIMKRLQSFYQQFGLSIKQGGEGDHPDHLVIQLEFMAYLLQRLDETDAEDQEQLKTLQSCVQEFSQEFAWVPNFATAIEQHPTHPFYSNLVRLMNKVILNLTNSLSFSE